MTAHDNIFLINLEAQEVLEDNFKIFFKAFILLILQNDFEGVTVKNPSSNNHFLFYNICSKISNVIF